MISVNNGNLVYKCISASCTA